jgi:peptidyl-prolyl cis-trans isomerase D
MRDHASSWMIKFILGAIVVVFVFWGVGSFRSQRLNTVASVNGDVITSDQYRLAYENLLNQYRRQFGNNLNNDLLQALQVDRQALERLVDQRLLVQQAQKLNLQVTEQELADAIGEMGVFQNAGMFDNQLYQRVLSSNRMSPEEFEAAQQEAMISEKLRSFIQDAVKTSSQEVEAWYNWRNTTVNIDYVLFESAKYTTTDLPADEVQAYFDQHQENYKTEPQVKIRYVHINPKDLGADITHTEEEVEAYFRNNRAEFEQEKTVAARHILLKLAPDADAETVEAQRQKAVDILAEYRGGADFAELARKYSEGPTKDKGGDLGTFGQDAMVKPFADKAFAMEAGEVSEPVRTSFGWHLIKVEKVNAAVSPELADVKAQIEQKLTERKAQVIAFDQAESLFDAAFDADGLMQAAEARNLEVKTSPLFGRAGPPGVAQRRDLAAAAFELEGDEISDVLEYSDGYYLIQLIEKQAEQIPAFDAVKTRVEADYRKVQQDENAKRKAEAFLEALKGGENMEQLGEKDGLEVKTSGFFKRNAAIPDLGNERALADAAFQLSAAKPLAEAVVKGSKGYFVMRYRDRKTPSAEDFAKEEAQTANQLRLQKRSRAFTTWLAQVKAQSDIWIKEGLLE